MNPIQVSEPDAGKTIAAKQGETIAVHLDENPTTGYQWHVRMEPLGPWRLVTTSYSPAPAGRIGAGGTRTWLLQAVHGGSAHLVFDLQRGWGDDKPVRHLDFELLAQ